MPPRNAKKKSAKATAPKHRNPVRQPSGRRRRATPHSAAARSVAVRRGPAPDCAAHTAQYIRSLRTDAYVPGLTLPAGLFGQAYAQLRTFYRGSLVSGADLSASVVINPYLAAFTDQFRYEVYNTGTLGTNICYPIMTNNATTPAGSLPNPSNYTVLSPASGSYWATSATNSYAAFVRIKGCHVRVLYTGTELNMGGEIVAFHNAHQAPLLINAAVAADGTANWASGFTSDANLFAAAEMSSIHRLGRSFEFVWRPRDLGFQRVESTVGSVAVATVTENNTNIANQGYLPNAVVPGNADRGWVTGFKLFPAAGSTGSAIPYVVEVNIDSDIIIQTEKSSGPYIGVSMLAGNIEPHHDPIMEAHLQNSLNHLRKARTVRTIPHNSTNLALPQGTLGHRALLQGEAYAKSAFSGAVAQLGASAMSALESAV
jgi:hypothetical protein